MKNKNQPLAPRKRPTRTASRKKSATASAGTWWKPLTLGIAGFLVLCLIIEYFKEGGRLAFLRHKVEEATQTNTAVTFSPEGYEVTGLDISHHQREIDWKAVKAQKIKFTFIKATEGITHQDRYFARHWRQAKKHDVLRGAYHFFLPARDAEKQARNFLNRVKLEAGDLPPVLDVEVTNHQSDEEIRAGVQLWLDMVEEEYGLKPIIYTNYAFYEKHLAGYFDAYPLWVAHYSPEKSHRLANRDWVFWQHTETGRLEGVKGNLDLNVFNGTMEDLYNMCYEPETL
ncbi:glycoside hydrolase family 25 protein [Rufibacter psychrotolerans]|uniref:glycoside hydrolase family 25 protein n=1 Tax=Rufibacter psychrotolerans TaxID=2812556 RepID=UPI00196808F1|nr:glycoside hydrolase family 25 protein [Rufibacter sp. SYSU D00308]